MVLKYLLSISFILLLSCSEKFINSKNTSSDYSIVILEKEIGFYAVKISSKDSSNFSVIKHDTLNGSISELAVNASNEVIDDKVESGHTYKYEVGIFSPNKSFEKKYETQIKIPLDLIVSKAQELIVNPENSIIYKDGSRYIKLNRVEFKKNALLITNGESLTLDIEKLYSDGGVIKTLPDGISAGPGLPGRSGGQILINAKYAKGSMHFILQGENGGVGLEPLSLGIKGKGDTGAKGAQGAANSESKFQDFGSYDVTEKCVTPPGKGGPGGKGKIQGLPGNQGQRGGDSGSAFLLADYSDDLKLTYEFKPGFGGNGSIGGIGSDGGDGGAPGAELVGVTEIDLHGDFSSHSFVNNIPQICPALYGDRGAPGDRGLTGIQGENGKINKFCYQLSLNNEVICNN